MITGNKASFFQHAQPLPLAGISSAVVMAPHPDDESLGCGGTIALLRQNGVPVSVIFVSDGSMSHPSSKKYPTDRLVALREKEAINALQILGVEASSVRFLRLKDGAVPMRGEPDFAEGVDAIFKAIKTLQPAALFVPWRRDPHKDHRATAAMVQAALESYASKIEVLEYFVWLWERSGPEDLPLENECLIRSVNIASVIELKQKAVMAHVSQVTKLIDDDPDGFMLSPEMLSHFWKEVEYFAEQKT